MSALAVLCRDDGIIVACDTIAFDSATGVIMSINAGKVLMVPEINTIIGSTGAGNFASFLRAVMGFK
jgi:hypothetical protein